MRRASLWSVVAAALASGIAAEARAQSLAGVPGAEINAGERTFDYRAGYALPADGRTDRFGQRFHYQQAVSGDWRIRVLVQQGEDGRGILQTQFVSLQSQHQFINRKGATGFASAVRFDGFIPVDNRPGRARVVLLNSLDLAGKVQLRTDVFLARDFGDERADGIDVETRAEISLPLSARTRLGGQLFDRWNTTADFGSLNEQRHQAGLFVRSRITEKLGVEAGWLFGVSSAAPDADVRIILTYSP